MFQLAAVLQRGTQVLHAPDLPPTDLTNIIILIISVVVVVVVVVVGCSNLYERFLTTIALYTDLLTYLLSNRFHYFQQAVQAAKWLSLAP